MLRPIQTLPVKVYFYWMNEISKLSEFSYETVPERELRRFFHLLSGMFSGAIPSEIKRAAGIVYLSAAIELLYRSMPIDARQHYSLERTDVWSNIDSARPRFKKAFIDLGISISEFEIPNSQSMTIKEMLAEIHSATEKALKASEISPQVRATLELLEETVDFALYSPCKDLSSHATTKLAVFLQTLLDIPVQLLLPSGSDRSGRQQLMEYVLEQKAESSCYE